MRKAVRFFKIEQIVHHRGLVSFQTLMDEMGVSRTTLSSDLDHLVNQPNPSIVFDRTADGYRFVEEPEAVGEQHEPSLPTKTLLSMETTVFEDLDVLFKEIMHCAPAELSTEEIVDTIQGRMKQAERENDQSILRLKDQFNSVAFYYNMVKDSDMTWPIPL